MKEHDQTLPNSEEIDSSFTKDSFIKDLLYLRDDWLRLDGSRSYSLTDGRVLWYLALYAQLKSAQDEGILPDSAKEEADKFIKWWSDPSRRDHKYPIVNKSREIDHANDVIDSVLKSLGVESKIDEKQKITNRLLDLRYDWTDEIPPGIVNSTDGNYKIRLLWFMGIAGSLDGALDSGLLKPIAEKSARSYLKWWSEEYGKEESRQKVTIGSDQIIINTQADIDRGNKVLDRALRSLGFTPKKYN